MTKYIRQLRRKIPAIGVETSNPVSAPLPPNEPFEATLVRVRNAIAVSLFVDLDADGSGPAKIV
jgi:hypothetical protein